MYFLWPSSAICANTDLLKLGVSKMMEKMENIVFDRNYEEDEPDPLAQAIFDRVNAPGGFLEEFSKKMDAIP